MSGSVNEYTAPEGALRELRLVIAGFGGQGALFAGKLIAYAGLSEEREVSWMPSYGPEMRGGTANCTVCLSDEPIGSPLVADPNAVIAMNQPSFDKFAPTVVPGGTIVVDSTLVQTITDVEGVHVIAIPATELAEQAGMKKLANVILTGKLFAQTAFCSEEALYKGVAKCVPASKPELFDLNKRALEIGMDAQG